MRKMTALFLLACTCIFVGANLLFAQETTPTPAPETIDCSPAAVIAAQLELAAQLETFAQDYRTEDPEALAALYDVGKAYQQLALDCGYIPDDAGTLVVGTDDVERILTVLETVQGDPIEGQLLYNGEIAAASGSALTCAACHEGGAIAPPTEGTWTRWDEEHRQEPTFADYTFEHYAVESIIRPWDYFVATYPEFTMPDYYHMQLSYQNLADLIAYLASQDQLE